MTCLNPLRVTEKERERERERERCVCVRVFYVDNSQVNSSLEHYLRNVFLFYCMHLLRAVAEQ